MDAAGSDFTSLARTLFAAFALSLRRLVRTPAVLAHVGLAAIPVFIVGWIHIVAWGKPGNPIASMTGVNATYEWFLSILYLHFVVFFIANIMGSAVMRQEREEQTLHYLFLQPVRRWMIIVAKYFAFLSVAAVLVIASQWATWLAMGLPTCGFRAVMEDLFRHHRAAIMLKESRMLVLALLAYGSLALLLGNFFKNATYSLILLAWEAGLPYLPSSVKFWTIAHYLQVLLPEPPKLQKELWEIPGVEPSLALSYLVLLCLPCVLLAFSVWLFRFRECLYGET